MIYTFLFSTSEVKSLPSREGTNKSVMGNCKRTHDINITGGINAPNSMPLC
jgi:hypothetical protein